MRQPSIPVRVLVLPLVTVTLLALSPGDVAIPTSDLDGNGIEDLANLFSPGYILQDRNADEIVDFVDLTILLPPQPSESVVAGAMNIAARIGYETTAIDLDLVEYFNEKTTSFDRPVIVVGLPDPLAIQMPTEYRVLSGQLRPGHGLVMMIRPGDLFSRGGVLVAGYDATGLLAASEYFSGRYPDIWQVGGKTWEDVALRFRAFLTDRDIEVTDIHLSHLVTGIEKEGITKLALTVTIDDGEAFARAVAALEGEEPEEKEEESESADKEEGEQQRKAPDLTSLEFSDLHRIAVRVVGPETVHEVDLLPRKPWQTRDDGGGSSSSSRDFPLSQALTIDGLFRDSDQDFVPDDMIGHFSIDGGDAADELVNLAARVGLETAGMRFPLAQVGGENDHPEDSGFPIIVGSDHYQTRRLLKEERLYGLPTGAGEGYLQFVPEAFNEKSGLVLGGTDAEGLEAITGYFARRMPWLWNYGKGEFSLEDVEAEVRRFFQSVKAGGQVSLALSKLDIWLDRIEERNIEKIDIEVAAREIDEGLDRFIRDRVRNRFPQAETSTRIFRTGFGTDHPVFNEEIDIPWEVDTFRALFREKALPGLSTASSGRIVVRVSESPEVRTDLITEIERELRTIGLDPAAFQIDVICAYKQGYSWLYDVILPRITGRDIGGIEITYHTLKDSREVRWQAIHANSRWLQEIFPIDTILARELGIPDSLVTFTPTQEIDPIYTVTVTDRSGGMILHEKFDPKYVVRPFYDLFPEYESVRVTTGWVLVEADGQVVLDERIPTDPEVFWDHLQTTVFGKIIDYVMDLQDGRPSAANAPYFDELRIDLTLSEPDYRLDVDEEVISSLEALHEDILFETLTLFNLIGNRYGVGALSYPGRVLPWVHAARDGEAGHSVITMTGRERAGPELIMTWTEAGSEPVKQRYPLSNLGVEPPVLRGISVRSGEEGLSRMLFEIVATDTVDRYDEYRYRGSESAIDQSFLSSELLADMVSNLTSLHAAGLFEDELSLDRVGEFLFRITLEDSSDYSRLIALPQSRSPLATENPRLEDQRFRYRGDPLVQWETPIPPGECNDILARLGTFPNVHVYYMATSLLGQDVFAVDLQPPVEAAFLSQAKMNALKPTLLLHGRVHGNEVSSTSHLLRLIELCATDSTWMEYLNHVNLVIYPVTNPDGAQIAYDMWQETPDFMLHVGRPGALGNDVTSGQVRGDHRYPEAGVVYRLREEWLPDIVIDMHGVPSHEWVQYFAGYSGWVRSRYGGARSYWLPRGWYIPGFSWIDDDRYPEIETAHRAITDSILTAVTSVPDVDATNQRIYDRYIKYGRQDEETYREYFYQGIQLEARLRGRQVSGSGVTGPKVTYFTMTTEAADETAYGDWLDLMCRAGLSSSKALLQYLYHGINEVERDGKASGDHVTRSVRRVKPVKPGPDRDDTSEGGGS
ncbi:M14 family metallopeptidase [Candidatus Zixiibacteriota bacterium]